MIHTIGHSNHPLEQFLALLSRHGITALADVRSTPYSRFNPQFRREKLQKSLASAGVRYVFLGAELGARTEDASCYDAEGRVSYEKLAATPAFQRGLQRLQAGMQEFRVAIMCAEREPLECHRTILVARELERVGVQVKHILADGSVESHSAAIQRLAGTLKIPEGDLFADPRERIERAYQLQAAKIAYVKETGRH